MKRHGYRHLPRVAVGVGVITCGVAAAAWAQPAAVPAAGPDLSAVLVRTVAALAGVIGLLLLIAVGLRRQRGRPGGATARGRALRVIAAEPLTYRKMIYVIELYGERLALAVEPQRVTFLTKLNSGGVPAAPPAAETPPVGFTDVLRHSVRAMETATPPVADTAAVLDKIKKLKELRNAL